MFFNNIYKKTDYKKNHVQLKKIHDIYKPGQSLLSRQTRKPR